VSRRARILVVDDEDTTRLLISGILEQAGYRVVSAADGEAALLAIEAERPALITLDLWMPGVDGWEILDWLAQRAWRPPVLVVSGISARQRVERLGRADVDYLEKPFTIDELLRRCERLLAERSAPTSDDGR
jgi:DNA-binding response OmpR family regulator